MRDIIAIPLGNEGSLIISSDNSGAIGMKEQDMVHVPYETVAYYAFRVAAMECMAAGGEPICVVLQNFCGNEPWKELVKGIQKGLDELYLSGVSITGSTESNFQLNQSAIGLNVIGKKQRSINAEPISSKQINLAIIGLPLVGAEVIEQNAQVVPLSIFQQVNKLSNVQIWPVGSKGILNELNQMFEDEGITEAMVITNIDVIKSSGPATCFIIAYQKEQEELLKELTGDFFHPLKIARR